MYQKAIADLARGLSSAWHFVSFALQPASPTTDLTLGGYNSTMHAKFPYTNNYNLYTGGGPTMQMMDKITNTDQTTVFAYVLRADAATQATNVGTVQILVNRAVVSNTYFAIIEMNTDMNFNDASVGGAVGCMTTVPAFNSSTTKLASYSSGILMYPQPQDNLHGNQTTGVGLQGAITPNGLYNVNHIHTSAHNNCSIVYMWFYTLPLDDPLYPQQEFIDLPTTGGGTTPCVYQCKVSVYQLPGNAIQIS